MRTVQSMLTAAESLDIKYLCGQALHESSDEYIKQQQAQMMDGERQDGTQIFNIKTGSQYYSDSYARYKGKSEPIDLHDTGDFYRGMETRQESEGLLIESDDWKNAMLTETYEPWLLNSQSKQEFRPVVQTKLAEMAIEQLNKK